MSTVFKHLSFFSVVKKLAAWSLVLILFAFGCETTSWYMSRTNGAHIEIAKGHTCDLNVSAFYLSNGTVTYSENGVRIGQTVLTNDLLYDPLAIFPCPDHHSVVCLTWQDYWQAAFTIDFSRRTSGGDPIPGRLKGIAVDSSDFEVRACTPDEITYVKKFIRTADMKSFAACTRWGASAETQDSKDGMLEFLTMATSPNDWHDPLLKNAAPLLFPEEVSMADTK